MQRVDPNNPRAGALHRRLGELTDLDALPPELCLVVGGDGWMLSCIRELGPSYVFLGLNTGHLGFLLNDPDDLADVARALRDRDWSAHSFPRLRLEAEGVDGQRFTAVAMNDLYVERRSGQTAHLRVLVDGLPVVNRLVCDGLLVATALGSTAYSYSAGGAPCHARVRAVLLTPVCPHSPRLSPLILPPDARVEIEVQSPERRPVRAVADGVDLGPIVRAHIGPADDEVRLAFLSGESFTRTLIRKVLDAR